MVFPDLLACRTMTVDNGPGSIVEAEGRKRSELVFFGSYELFRMVLSAMNVRKAGWFLLALLLAGCKARHEDATTQSSTTPAIPGKASSPIADPQAAFIAAYRQASERKDIGQMLQLYCWDGVDADLRETIRGNVQDELSQSVADVKIEPPPPGKYGPTVEGGIRWKPNLPVVAVLKARFSPSPGRRGLALSQAEYGLGLKDGQYRLVVNVRDK
jgi:hypothetical protein